MGILVRPLPMENGCEALNISKELLLRGYAGRHTDSGAAWKKRVSVGTNCNFELILLPAGVGTGGVPNIVLGRTDLVTRNIRLTTIK